MTGCAKFYFWILVLVCDVSSEKVEPKYVDLERTKC